MYKEPFQYSADWYERVYHEELKDPSAEVAFGCHEERDLACLAAATPQRDDRVLCCGCGAGENAGLLVWKWGVHDLTLVDWSETAVAFCRRRFPNAKVVRADVSKLAFVDESFDLVVAMDLTEHLSPVAYSAFLAEALRVIDPLCGRMVVLPGMTDRLEHINLLSLSQIAQDMRAVGFRRVVGYAEWLVGYPI